MRSDSPRGDPAADDAPLCNAAMPAAMPLLDDTLTGPCSSQTVTGGTPVKVIELLQKYAGERCDEASASRDAAWPRSDGSFAAKSEWLR